MSKARPTTLMGCAGVALAALQAMLAIGCAVDRPIRLDIPQRVIRPERSAVVFFTDGLDVRVLDEMLAGGELPNIARRFVRGGVRVRHAIASMPSNTYPNAVSLVTGVFPGRHGIVGNRWFDRCALSTEYYIRADTFRNVNQQFLAPTIFERLADRLTVAVQFHTRRGAGVVLEDDLRMALHWMVSDFLGHDRQTGELAGLVDDTARAAGRWPALTVFYFPGIDELGHRFGTDSPRYRDAVRNADVQIGRITAAWETAGLMEHTYWVLVSDHGHATYGPDESVDVAGWLHRTHGLRVYQGDAPAGNFLRRRAAFERYDAYVANGSFRCSAIHVRGTEGWHASPPTERLRGLLWPGGEAGDVSDRAALFALRGVELAALPAGENRVEVYSRRGQAEVEASAAGDADSGTGRANGAAPRLRYRLINRTGDALGYGQTPELDTFVRAGWHDSQEWLAATAGMRVPDFVPQVVEMFRSRRSGDIVLFASERGTFQNDERSGHGSCLASDMRITLFFAGPDMPGGREIGAARMVDVTPTLLELLQAGPESLDVRIDGRSIAPALQQAPEARS